MLRRQQRGHSFAGRLRRSGLALAALLFCGCPTQSYTRQTAPPEVKVLLGKVGARQQQVAALRGKATVDHWDGKQRVKGDVNILMARPGSLHFRATDPTGGVAAKLTTDGHDFALLDVVNNRFLVGAATPCNLARLAQIAMQPGNIIDILVGGVPLPVGARASLEWNASAGTEVITLALPGGGSQIIQLDGRGKAPSYDVVSAQERGKDGKVIWKLSHHDYRVVDGVRIPAVTKFEQPARKADVIIKWDSQAVNPDPPIPDAAWHLDSELPAEMVTCDDQAPAGE
jgi:Domain of unknown function (DUF4292)